MLQTIFIMALRSLRRNWRQSLTALISIAMSFVSLTLFQGYMDDVQKMYEDANIEREMMGHLIIEKKNPTNLISEEEQAQVLEELKSSGEVDSYVRFLPITGTITNGRTSMVFVGRGLDVSQSDTMRKPSWGWNALAGAVLPADGEGLLIGHKLAQILGCTPDAFPDFVQGKGGFSAKVRPMNCPRSNLQLNVVTVNGQMNAMNLGLTGITDAVYKELDERYLALPLPLAQSLIDTKEVGYFSVKLKNKKKLHSFIDRLNTSLGVHDLVAVRWEDHRLGDLYNRTMDLLTLFRNFVVTVILVISGLSVFNTLLRNISERSREIGTLRSLGLKTTHIRGLFALEAALLALLGSFIGCVLSFISEISVNALGLTYRPGIFASPVPFNISVSLDLLAQTALFLSTLVILTALLSVRRPLKQRITECLGHV